MGATKKYLEVIPEEILQMCESTKFILQIDYNITLT